MPRAPASSRISSRIRPATVPPICSKAVEIVGADLALGAAFLTAPLGQFAGEDAEVELEAEVLRRLVGEPVDELRREELLEPLLGLTRHQLDLVAAVELDALEDLRLALALVPPQ